MSREDVLEMICHDIELLQNLMFEVEGFVSDYSHPLLVQVSQVLDAKLNQRDRLISPNM